MKNFITAAISYLVLVVSSVWAIVEFILYLVKDNPFNWTSVVLTVVGFILLVVFGLRSVLKD